MIRLATPDDLEELRRLAANFLTLTKYGDALGYNPREPDRLEAFVAGCLFGSTTFVAEVTLDQARRVMATDLVTPPAGWLAGFLSLYVEPEHVQLGEFRVAQELAWWVQPEFRHGRLGPQLLGAAKKWATTNGVDVLKLVAPAGSDVGAFLERMGFRALETAYIIRLGQ